MTGRHISLWLLALILTCLAAGLRLPFLDAFPSDFAGDEGAHGVDALSVLNGNHAVFFPANNGREGLIVYTTAILIPFLGRSPLAVRLPVAVASVLAVPALFWLAQVLYADDKRRNGRWGKGRLIGSAASGLLAVSLGQTIIGRTGYRANFVPLLLVLGLGFLWSGLRLRSTTRLVAAGVFMGGLAYTYSAVRAVPFLLLLLALSQLWTMGRGWQPIRHYARELILFLITAFLVALPILVHFILHPEHLWARASQVSLLQFADSVLDMAFLLLRNLLLHLGAMGFTGDPRPRANYEGWPMLNPLEALFFWIGVLVALRRWRRPPHRLLILWLVVMIAPAVLTLDLENEPPNSLRMIGAVPAIYLLVGLGLWWSIRMLSRQSQRMAWLRAGPLQPDRYTWAGAVVLVLGMVVVQGAITSVVYFQRWPETVMAISNPEWVDLANHLNTQEIDDSTTYVIPYNNTFPADFRADNFAFLYTGKAPTAVVRAADEDFPQRLHALLSRQHHRAVVQVAAVVWERQILADPTQRIPFLLAKYGHFSSSEDHPHYRIWRYTDLQLDEPWNLYDKLVPLAVQFDGNLTLRGVALGRHGGRQFSLKDPVVLDAGTELWLVLAWQADGESRADYRVSVRIFDERRDLVLQTDEDLWNPLRAPTSRWEPGEGAESLHAFALPSDLPTGLYEMRLIVYNAQTLVPIVQVSSWESEVPVARLQAQNRLSPTNR